MKNLLIILNVFLILVSCSDNKSNNQANMNDKYAALVRENDSLKKLVAAKDTIVQVEKIPNQNNNNTITAENRTGKGKHPITLQWISWDKPGYVDITPLPDGWYAISGSQRNNKTSDYLKIDGKIRRISEKELEFDGIIETLVGHNNNGEVCIKEGKQTFFAKGNRKYFRLQNMTNCEGGMLVDYVDIYPGTSSL